VNDWDTEFTNHHFYNWKGQTRTGRWQMGKGLGPDTTLCQFVETRYHSRWRSLVVTQDGETVGAIEQKDGKRVWWVAAN
jgi:hypothetical protein